MASKSELRRFRSNLSGELESAALYETLAGAEYDSERKQVYAELAASERDHARVWSEKLRANGVSVRTCQNHFADCVCRTRGRSLFHGAWGMAVGHERTRTRAYPDRKKPTNSNIRPTPSGTNSR